MAEFTSMQLLQFHFNHKRIKSHRVETNDKIGNTTSIKINRIFSWLNVVNSIRNNNIKSSLICNRSKKYYYGILKSAVSSCSHILKMNNFGQRSSSKWTKCPLWNWKTEYSYNWMINGIIWMPEIIVNSYLSLSRSLSLKIVWIIDLYWISVFFSRWSIQTWKCTDSFESPECVNLEHNSI